jgi:dUTP pyrophosphatase
MSKELNSEFSQEDLEKMWHELSLLDDGDDSYKPEDLVENIFGISVDEYKEIFEDAMKTKTLGFKKLHPDAIEPFYNYEKDSGFDLCSVEEVVLKPLSRLLVSTGLAFNIPDGHEIQIRPKSGLAINYGITVLNTPSTIDGGYVGEVKVILFNTSREEFPIKKGTKIAQAVVCPVVQGKYVNLENIDELPQTDRSDKGFGSTGIQL